jgi:hypothetical protein
LPPPEPRRRGEKRAEIRVRVKTDGYVAAQLGHAKPTTPLAHYAHWLPAGTSSGATAWASAEPTFQARLAPDLTPSKSG